MLLATAPAAPQTAVCHIHPPSADGGDPARLIGPYADAQRCEQARALRFGPAGRCHCSAPFTPDWLGREPARGRRSARDQPLRPGAGSTPELPLP